MKLIFVAALALAASAAGAAAHSSSDSSSDIPPEGVTIVPVSEQVANQAGDTETCMLSFKDSEAGSIQPGDLPFGNVEDLFFVTDVADAGNKNDGGNVAFGDNSFCVVSENAGAIVEAGTNSAEWLLTDDAVEGAPWFDITLVDEVPSAGICLNSVGKITGLSVSVKNNHDSFWTTPIDISTDGEINDANMFCFAISAAHGYFDKVRIAFDAGDSSTFANDENGFCLVSVVSDCTAEKTSSDSHSHSKKGHHGHGHGHGPHGHGHGGGDHGHGHHYTHEGGNEPHVHGPFDPNHNNNIGWTNDK